MPGNRCRSATECNRLGARFGAGVAAGVRAGERLLLQDSVPASLREAAPELVLDMASVRGVGHRSRCGSWCRCRLSDERFEPKWRRMFHCQKADSSRRPQHDAQTLSENHNLKAAACRSEPITMLVRPHAICNFFLLQLRQGKVFNTCAG